MIKDIYAAALENMQPDQIDHWCSDLYIKKTPVSEKLVNEYEYKRFATVFRDQINNELWYEIPFAYYGKGWRG